MKIQDILLEFSPTTGAALGDFFRQSASDLNRLLQNLSIQNVDLAVGNVYDDFITGLRAAIKKDPSTKQNVDKYFNTFTRTTFGKTITPALQQVNPKQLVKNGKINSPYIKKVFRQALVDMTKSKQPLAVGTKPRFRVGQK